MDELVIAGKKFKSRLITGTGKHRSSKDLHDSIVASETEMITVAIRRINFDDPKEKNLLDVIDWDKYNILPNTAGSKTAEEAIYTAMLAREVTQSNWIKVEVIPDAKFLLPDPIGTLEACEKLVKEGFIVLPYISPDPVLAKRLEDVGCSTVMPLGSPIGSGRGVLALEEIQIIIEQSGIPVVVDAGLGVPSEASLVMESGADAVLVNTAIAGAHDPKTMGEAFKLGVRAGRKAFLSGRIPITKEANPSSPKDNIVNT
ncbi:MAG: thiazole synthase [Chloroflexota bacterium]|nr:thiazole synthase [Chloroflexota bacterium]MED5255401.1 thiazole synthase [Chloroflexota bacterium]MQG23974.1 thiazole synthase [SAR202 cluster bacterium]|tara:strand:+ start:27138 stop:27911 length:774 start_codon:yes stop_codon:yes gene_type:complete